MPDLVSITPCGAGAAACIDRLLAAGADRNPSAVALAAPGRIPLTYAGLYALVTGTVRSLNQAGIGRGDRVALVLPNGPEMAAAFLAVAACATCAPLNPAYRAAEFDFYLGDLGARALILPGGSDTPVAAVAREHGIPVIELRPLPDEEAGRFALAGGAGGLAAAPGLAGPEDVALVLHTSGTTSRPKMVPLTHHNVCASAANVRDTLALVDEDRCLNVMPLFHIHGLIAALLASLAAGGSVVCTPGFYATEFFAWMDECRPTWYTAVPTMHQAVLSRAASHAEVIRRCPLRLIRSSSASLAPQVMAELESTFQAPVIEAYGMTEAAHQMASNPLPPRARKPGSVGMAAGPEVAIMDEEDGLLPPGQIGEVVIRGENVTSGYEANPEANGKAFTAGWFRTGDQGYLDDEGYLFLTGRLKELINRGGEKISPREVDEVLLDHPAVAQAVAFALPDPRLGEDVAAAVTLREGAETDPEELREFASRRLADYKVPRRVVILDEIPKGPTGKLQRIGLADRLGLTVTQADVKEASTGTAPRTATEEAIARIWAEVLHAEQVGVEDGFIHLGGDSILATQVVSRVRDAFQVDIPVLLLLGEEATVAAMARRVDEAGSARALPPIEPGPRRGEIPITFAQERLWLLDQLEPGSPVFITPAAARLTGALDRDALERSLNEIVRRHEALRTGFVMVDGRPCQVVAPFAPVPLPFGDLREVQAPEREAAAQSIAAGEAARPFDLAHPPLFRPLLLRLDEEEHLLLLTAHHIVTDGWSMGVLCDELSVLYQAFAAGRPSPLPELPIQYADFALWQRRWLTGEALEKPLAFWRDRLASPPPALELPADRPRPAVQAFRGRKRFLRLPVALAAELRDLCRRESVTPFMLLLAAYQTLLHRITGVDDLVVGTPLAGRSRVETEGLVGLFSNTLPLRTDLSGDPSFRELLGRVRRETLAMLAHQDVPADALVRGLGADRDLSHAPLYQVMFILVNTPRMADGGTGLTFSPVTLDNGTAKLDLTIELWDGPDTFHGYLEYNTDLFDAQTAEQMAQCFEVLLHGIVADPGRPLSALPLLTEAERRRVLAEWNSREVPYPRGAALHHLVEAQVVRTPEAVAVEAGSGRLSYRELNSRANRLAHLLRARGIGLGSLIGIRVERSLEMAVGLLGILKAGGAYLPLDPAYPAERLQFVLRDSQASLLLTQERLLNGLPADAPETICLDSDWDAIAAHSDTNPGGGATAEDAAYVIYTSGSTGTPKGVLVPHRAVVSYVAAILPEYGICREDRVLQFSSISFDAAVEEIFPAWSVGATVVLRTDEMLASAEGFHRAIAEQGITFLGLPTAFWHEWVRGLSRGSQVSDSPSQIEGQPSAGPQSALPETLRLVVVGGEEASPAVYQAWREIAGNRVRWLNTYGPTEATVVATVYHPDDGSPAGRAASRLPIGRPIANVQAFILDTHLNPVPVGIPGELFLGGENLAHGYLNRPELTSERFVFAPCVGQAPTRLYRTGDLARYLPDGNIEFLGRADHQVKLRGFRIELGEIEAVLKQFPGISDAVVLLREDAPGDKRLVAYVVGWDEERGTGGKCGAPSPDSSPGSRPSSPSPGEIRRYLKERLPEYMLPSAFVMLDALPLTATGKTDRRALPAPDGVCEQAGPAFEAPRTPVEETLAGIWADVLHLGRVGIHESFFEVGGHSLLAMQVISRVREELGVALPLRAFFEQQSIAAQALAITRMRAEDEDGDEMARILLELEMLADEDAERSLAGDPG